ncbi:hypothetical protein MOQ_000531 [Trypanosoma cruzi marinkellei]|uniref:Uncharacterized protein n=1 Tax=Trypanosoma cruzi marinkellei TaxID=85056 RepID=K2NW27_TRYCR|nr:hypothetical protein MOQ_000531 [Trypanosoma cruzi marinkellei]
MSRSCSPQRVKKGLGQKGRHRGPQSPTRCLLLHSFEECGGLPVTCVTDGSISPGPYGQLQEIILFYGNKKGNLKAFQFWNGRTIATAGQRKMASVTALLLIPGRSLLWCGDEKGVVTVFRLPAKEGWIHGELFLRDGILCDAVHPASVTCFAAGDDNFVYSGSADGTIFSWSMGDSFEFAGKVGQHTGELAQMVLVCDDYLVSVGSASAMVHVWPLGNKRVGQEPFALKGHLGGVLSCLYVGKWCSGGGLLWSAGEDCFIHVWDVNNPVHFGCRITCRNEENEEMMNDHTRFRVGKEEEEVRAVSTEFLGREDDSLQVNSLRLLVGHKESVVALSATSGILFSCDSSGLILAWNPERYWLLHAFTVPRGERLLQSPSNVFADRGKSVMVEAVRGAHCLGFIEGFCWIINTAGGPRCMYMPNHTSIRKLLCNGNTEVSPFSGERAGLTAFMHLHETFLHDAVSLFMQYIEFHAEVFAHAAAVLQRWDMPPHCGSCSLECFTQTFLPGGPHNRCGQTDSALMPRSPCEGRAEMHDLQTARRALEEERGFFAARRQEEEERWRMERQSLNEEAIRLEERAEALDRLQTILLETEMRQEYIVKENEELLRCLKKRDRDRERQLARVSTELAFLRLKYADWGGVKESGV